MKIVIIGAGPAGLGAALTLEKAGHADWELWEALEEPGGLSRSVVDERGFVWDIGGHVQFSHYRTFDQYMDQALGADGWLEHRRESWIRALGAWIPYPIQYNLRHLPKEWQVRCLKGLVHALESRSDRPAANFEEFIQRQMGEGLAELFMNPYNFKVWAHPPRDLATGWVGERVAIPDLGRVMESIILDRDDVSWGPNSVFRFPLHGGTGSVWRALAGALPPDKLRFGCAATAVDPMAKTVQAEDGTRISYDALISTMPLDLLVEKAGLSRLRPAADKLMCSAVHVVGVGLEGQPDPSVADKCWMYFPESNCPFFRVTVFSNYSPNNVPDITRQWSLMAEVSQSPKKPVNEARVVEDVVQGLLNTGLVESRSRISHTFHLRADRAYPTPGLERDAALRELLPALEKMGIYSRGRMGAWKYETGNMDHAMMQGVEVARRLLHGSPELTLWFPNQVNQTHPVYGKDWL